VKKIKKRMPMEVYMDSYRDFAEIYDELINDDIDYELWKKAILELCKDNNINSENYLDVGCGTGNMTVLLAPHFKNIWGVDLSEDMLFQAEEKLRENRLKARFVCQDMRMLNLNKKFDLITCCLDALNYLLKEEDLILYFKSIHEHLKDDGIFVFDINSYYKLKEIIGNNTFTYCEEDVAYIWENQFEDDIVYMYLAFFVKEGNSYNRFDEEHRERAYKEVVIDKILEQCGLKVKLKLDNYKNSVKDNSERITYIVAKNKTA
jgi:ubiquinone/menaquinone biosynthesis C-methylase UbiE